MSENLLRAFLQCEVDKWLVSGVNRDEINVAIEWEVVDIAQEYIQNFKFKWVIFGFGKWMICLLKQF